MVDGLVDRWRLALPTIDIHTIGAGGGSIAWLDEGGLLHVGPQSAGAAPGPACYGRGGSEPTVTDADLVLGYLAEESFAHGGMRARPGGGARRLRAARRGARAGRRGGGGRRLRAGQRDDGDRGAGHQRPPRPRPARLPAGRRRRRRAAARGADRPRARDPGAAGAARLLDLLRRRDAALRLQARRRARPQGAARREPARGGDGALRGDGSGRRRDARPRGRRPRAADPAAGRSTSATSASGTS